jgi:hypothetical protein
VAEDADRLVARAIESVLDQVPGALDTTVPDVASAKLQPWAETAAPVGRNKRPLEELLAELEERVAADPDARATLPHARHHSLSFFDRFGRTAAQPGGAEPGGRHRRRRRGGGGADPAKLAEGAGSVTVGAPAGSSPNRPPGSRRRSRRGRGGGGAPGGDGPRQPGAVPQPPRQESSPPAGQPRAPGSGGRRRRGRRGRGGDRQPPG